jgi:hypothetical protein
MKLAPSAFALALAACAAAPGREQAYDIRTDVYELPTELAQSLTGREGWGALPAPAGLVERVQAAADSRTDVVASSRPRIRVREGSTAEISNMSETDYVQDWKVDAQGKAQAVHAKAPDGLEFELRPRAVEAALELDFRIQQCSLQQPIPEVDRTLANGETVKVQLPILVGRETKSKATLAPGECLAALLPGRVEGRATLVCVRAERVAGP